MPTIFAARATFFFDGEIQKPRADESIEIGVFLIHFFSNSAKRKAQTVQNSDLQTIISGCLAGERLAQKRLYEQYQRAMFTTAYRMTGDHDRAGEVLQDAFLQVFRRIEQFRGESTIGAWIKTIVVRTAWRAIQKAQRPEFSVESFPTDKGAENWASARLDAEYLEQAILKLPPGYRMVFLLAEVEGYSHAEIAAELSISEGTSKSQLFFAKKRLREMLS